MITILNHATRSCKDGKYVESVINNSVVMRDEILPPQKIVPAEITSTKVECTSTKCYILLVFSLFTIALLIAVNIYCYLIKYQVKQNIYSFTVTALAN